MVQFRLRDITFWSKRFRIDTYNATLKLLLSYDIVTLRIENKRIARKIKLSTMRKTVLSHVQLSIQHLSYWTFQSFSQDPDMLLSAFKYRAGIYHIVNNNIKVLIRHVELVINLPEKSFLLHRIYSYSLCTGSATVLKLGG